MANGISFSSLIGAAFLMPALPLAVYSQSVLATAAQLASQLGDRLISTPAFSREQSSWT
jgi:hypothetical protein